MKMKAQSLPFTYINNTGLYVNQGDFGIANLLFKIPPGSQYSYNIQTNINALGNGSVSFCTIKTTNRGQNIPCQKKLNHSFTNSLYTDFSRNNYYIKISDFIYSGSLCNISKAN